DFNSDGGVLFHILPWIEEESILKNSLDPSGDDRNNFMKTYSQWNVPHPTKVKIYICPSDYTYRETDTFASYGANGQVFRQGYGNWGGACMKFPAGLPDVTSNTIFYTDNLSLRSC